MDYIGRRKPYTEIGIARVACAVCKKNRASQQWNICANGNRWVPICTDCDIELNEMVLKFAKVKNRYRLMRRYRKRMVE